MHVSELFAPCVVENLPALQRKQSISDTPPPVSKYLPLGHAVHCWFPGAAENFPGMQCLHVDEVLDPSACEDFPIAHSVQWLCPAEDRYFPAPHSIQCVSPGVGAWNPTVQFAQFCNETLPLTLDSVPTGHCVHLDAPVLC